MIFCLILAAAVDKGSEHHRLDDTSLERHKDEVQHDSSSSLQLLAVATV